MDGAGCLACRGLLVREACVGVGGWSWVSSLWSAMECPAVSFEMGPWVWCDFGRPVC